MLSLLFRCTGLDEAETFDLKPLGRLKHFGAYIALVLILSIAFSINLWLVAQDNRPPLFDYAGYLSTSIRAYNAITHGSLTELVSALSDPYRPPLVPLSALPFYVLLGTSYRSAMLANLVYVAVLVVSTYKLGRALCSAGLGLVLAGIMWSLPGVMAYDRAFGLDFPLTALVCAGMYFTVTSDGFRKRNSSIALGVVVGLGLLTKWSYFVFVSPMIAVVIIQERRAINIQNMILAGVFAAAISSTWYANAFNQGLIQKLAYYAWGPGAIPYAPTGSLFDLSALLYYLYFLHRLIGPFYGIVLPTIFCLGLAQVLRHPRFNNGRSIKPVGFSFLVSLLVFSLLQVKDVRFFLPATGSLVVALAWVGWHVRVRRAAVGRILLLGVLIVGSVISVVGAIYPTIGVRFDIYDRATISETYPVYNDYSPPKPQSWKLEEVVSLIAALDPNAKIGILACHWAINQDTLNYYALRLGFDRLSFRDFRDPIYPPYNDTNYYDFVLMKTGDLGGTLTNYVTRLVGRLREDPGDAFYVQHNMIQSYDMPDGSQLLIFMKKELELSNQNPGSLFGLSSSLTQTSHLASIESKARQARQSSHTMNCAGGHQGTQNDPPLRLLLEP